MLHAGDLVNQRNDSVFDDEWGEWTQTGGYAFASIPQLPIAGNHEYLDVESAGVESKVLSPHWGLQFALPGNGPEATRATTYYVDYQGVRFIALDGTAALDLGAMQAQAAWFESVMSRPSARWTIVSFHQPVYPCARADDGVEFRDEWAPLFRAFGVDLVLQGHDHCYARTTGPHGATASSSAARPLEGPVYVVSVAGAKMYRVTARAHERADRVAEDTELYQVIDVEAERLRFRAFTAAGELYDAFDLLRDGDGRNLLVEMPARLPPARVCSEGIGPDGIVCLSRMR
jgi:3',5'-cyclic AMP phosphodiesterase CpdA